MTFEYKTLTLPFNVFGRAKALPALLTELNQAGAEGWQLKQLILPSSYKGTTSSMIAILERSQN